jgi:hypothetical protein
VPVVSDNAVLQPRLTVRFPPARKHNTLLPKPVVGVHVSKLQANRLLSPADGVAELKNQFNGPSCNPAIPLPAVSTASSNTKLSSTSLCTIQVRRPHGLAGRCVLKGLAVAQSRERQMLSRNHKPSASNWGEE